MISISHDKITIDSIDAYVAVYKFLEKYNENIESPDLCGLMGDLTQVHLAQSVFRMWLETLREVLVETGSLEALQKTADDSLQIVPNKITIKVDEIYGALMIFLRKYNENLQSKDINRVINEIAQGRNSLRAYNMWTYSFKEALVEADLFKEYENASKN